MRRNSILCLSALGAVAGPAVAEPARPIFYRGADMSFANEMEDCGAVYRERGRQVDPFALMSHHGANIVRVRIWNDARWTRYSDFADVLKTSRRAHRAGMKVLLDFHYSDDWADGDKQHPPAAWAKLDAAAQARALHDYTRQILDRLQAGGQAPELVQVGNETNPEMLSNKPAARRIDWTRNALLINAGLSAVREFSRASGKAPEVMLHVAQPENIVPWFDAAEAAGVRDFDMIGISYYRKWSKLGLDGLEDVIRQARARYGKQVMVVETAYPFTLRNEDTSGNLLGQDSLIPGYAATPAGQLKYLRDLTQLVRRSGGNGVVYWAPDWVSTQCKTRWGTGSGWENAAWFGFSKHEALPAMNFLRGGDRK